MSDRDTQDSSGSPPDTSPLEAPGTQKGKSIRKATKKKIETL